MTGKLSKEEAAELKSKAAVWVLAEKLESMTPVDDPQYSLRVRLANESERAFERRLAELTEG